MGRGCRPHRHRSWYSTFAPFPDTRPRNQPALGQTYATVVFGAGRVSGEQMLTVGRGLWTTATNQWRAFPASGLAAVIYVSDNCLGTQHSALWPRRRVVMQRQTKLSDKIVCRYSIPPAQHKERHVITLRYEARAEREARDTRTGLAAEPLVPIKWRTHRGHRFCDVISHCVCNRSWWSLATTCRW